MSPHYSVSRSDLETLTNEVKVQVLAFFDAPVEHFRDEDLDHYLSGIVDECIEELPGIGSWLA